MLNKKQVELLAGLLRTKKMYWDYNKAFTNTGKKEVWKNFSENVHLPIYLPEESHFSVIFDKAFNYQIKREFSLEEKLKLQSSEVHNLEVIKNASKIKIEEEEEMIEFSSKEITGEKFEIYSSIFNSVMSQYSCVVSKLFLVLKVNVAGTRKDKFLDIEFNYRNRKTFQVAVPLIGARDLFCTFNNHLYSFAYSPKNLEEYLSGEDDKLELLHPYSFLMLEALHTSKTSMYSTDFFETIVMGTKKRMRFLERKVEKVLLNAKDNPWDDRNVTPIMWIDPERSEIGKLMLANNIQLNLSFEALQNCIGVKGFDINTGSTSQPGKRCRIAANYKIVRTEDGRFFLEKVINGSEIFDHINTLKKMIYPAFLKTSGKRDNTSTIKDTYSLVNPSNYQKKFKLNF